MHHSCRPKLKEVEEYQQDRGSRKDRLLGEEKEEVADGRQRIGAWKIRAPPRSKN